MVDSRRVVGRSLHFGDPALILQLQYASRANRLRMCSRGTRCGYCNAPMHVGHPAIVSSRQKRNFSPLHWREENLSARSAKRENDRAPGAAGGPPFIVL